MHIYMHTYIYIYIYIYIRRIKMSLDVMFGRVYKNYFSGMIIIIIIIFLKPLILIYPTQTLTGDIFSPQGK